jgi:glycosyltransferase involved in cell wall biosynthesis
MELQISVVIPSYNPNLNTLTECLKAVQDSNFKPLEVILVDDGSLIDYPEEIKTYCKIIKNKINMGPAYTRNIGAKEAKGNILFFLDADVKITNDTFSKVVEKFSNADIEAVQTIYSKSTPVKNYLSQYQNLYQHYNFNNIKQKYLCRLSTYAVAVKKDVFFEVGGFPEFVKNASIEDGLLGMALYSKGYRILLAKDIQVEHLAYFDMKRLLNRMFVMGRNAIEHFGVQKQKKMELSKTPHTLNRIVTILLSPLILLFLMIIMLPISKIIVLLFILVFLLINADFFIFVYKDKGMLFMLKSIIIYYLVCLSIFLGFLKGYRLFNK